MPNEAAQGVGPGLLRPDLPLALRAQHCPGIVLDFDECNQVIGIEIEDASTFIDLSRLEVSALPISSLILNMGS